MRKFLLFLFLLSTIGASAQQTFIRSTNDPNFGNLIKVLPLADSSWVVCSMDSMKITKFNTCGFVDWSNQYQIPNDNIGLSDVITTSDNCILMVTRMLSMNIEVSLVTKLDASGNMLWSKSYEDGSYQHFPYSIHEDASGNYIVYANVEHLGGAPLYNMLMKIDNSGNVIWTQFYDHGGIWGGSITTADNGILLRTSNTFIKTDSAGTVQWTSIFNGGSYYYYAPVELNDGYIFTGYITGNPNVSFSKIDKNGTQLWSDRRTSDFAVYPKALHKKSNGNFISVFLRTVGATTYPVAAEFDKDLNIVHQVALNSGAIGINLIVKDICITADGDPIMAGAAGNSNALFVAKLTPDFKASCEQTVAPMSLTYDPVNISSGTTTSFAFTMNSVNRNYGVVAIPTTSTTLCAPLKNCSLGPDTILCEASSLILTNHTVDVFDKYLWSTGETTSSIEINTPGKYWLQVNDNCEQNVLVDTIEIVWSKVIAPDLGSDLFLCDNESIVLKSTPCDSCNYLWSNGSIADAIEVEAAGIYWLKITNNDGCSVTDSVLLQRSKCECDVYLPNAFTPNEDGLNENFQPFSYCDFNNYQFKIYNRWGQKVFDSGAVGEGWNGQLDDRPAPEGVYVYSLNYTPLLKGRKGKEVFKTGTVTVFY
ncbi:hypothetical protein BH11BAC2_BH11BAC2_14330 [soil metagenome]